MAIIQRTNDIRYLRRKNLDEEARILGNYYRDIVNQFGIDCVYYKMDMTEFNDFKNVVDQNTILKKAYGYDITPDYTVSAEMVAFAEIDSDIFALNKFGIQPNTDINLIFDSTQFACDLAPKVGMYKEYPIDETEFVCEVPEFSDRVVVNKNSFTGETVSSHISDDVWPYELGLGRAETYSCGVLSGKLRCVLSGYELDKETTVVCDPYEHTDFDVKFPVNDDLYYSLKYKIENDDYLETLLFLTYRVSKTETAPGEFKYILSGKIHGSVLFFDVNRIGKYVEKIHPMVGDIVAIDFPDENNREKYEITECFDKQLTQDGINPLLHKYVWKCKARRYVNSREENAPEPTEAEKRIEEKLEYDSAVNEVINKQIAIYNPLDEEGKVLEDAAYGGYELDQGNVVSYDKQSPGLNKREKYDYVEDGTAIDIMRFGCGSRLVTNGYDLIFITAAGDAYVVSTVDHELSVRDAVFESGLRWLKATDSQIVFVNIEGQSCVLAQDEIATKGEMEICLNALHESTLDAGSINANGHNFIKFKESRSVVWATDSALYARLDSNKRLYRLV